MKYQKCAPRFNQRVMSRNEKVLMTIIEVVLANLNARSVRSLYYKNRWASKRVYQLKMLIKAPYLSG